MTSVASALLFALTNVYAQSTQPAAREVYDVNVVEVAVTVVGRNGEAVRQLSKENFEVIDGGKKREIAYFEEIVTGGAEAAPREQLPPAARRNFLVLFDLANSTPGTIARAQEAARDFVAKGLGDSDLAAIASFSHEQGFRLITSFTTDRALLQSGIDTLGLPQIFRVADPLMLSAFQSGTAVGGALPGSGPSGPGAGNVDKSAMSDSGSADFDRMNSQLDDSYRRGRVEQQMANFSAVAKMLDRIRGRKQVILLSEGFDARLLQGREARGTSDFERSQADAVASGEVWNVDSDSRYGNVEATNRLRDMATLFKRSDVVLHAIDIKGLRSDVDAAAGLKGSSSEGLYLLSSSTGGELFKNQNDISGNFNRLLKQQEVVYVIGFHAPQGGKPGEFRPLKVQLKNVPGARVSHRAGYYAAGGSLSPVEQALSAVDVMMTDVPRDEVKFTALAAPFPTGTEKVQVPVVIEVPGPDFIQGASDKQIDAELFVYAFDEGNTVRDFLHQKISLDLTKAREALMASGVKYYGTLALPPGDYALKVLLRRNDDQRTGYQRVDLRVPDFKTASVLRPFVVQDSGQWIMLKGTSNVQAEYPFALGADVFIPSAGAQLTRKKDNRLALFTYNMPELQMSATLKDSSGNVTTPKIALVGRTPADQHGATKLLLTLDTEALAPGNYVLSVAVRDKQTPPQSVSLPFVLR